MKKLKVLSNDEATKKVIAIRNQITDDEMAEAIGICKATLYKRIRERRWKRSELVLINEL